VRMTSLCAIPRTTDARRANADCSIRGPRTRRAKIFCTFNGRLPPNSQNQCLRKHTNRPGQPAPLDSLHSPHLPSRRPCNRLQDYQNPTPWPTRNLAATPVHPADESRPPPHTRVAIAAHQPAHRAQPRPANPGRHSRTIIAPTGPARTHFLSIYVIPPAFRHHPLLRAKGNRPKAPDQTSCRSTSEVQTTLRTHFDRSIRGSAPVCLSCLRYRTTRHDWLPRPQPPPPRLLHPADGHDDTPN